VYFFIFFQTNSNLFQVFIYRLLTKQKGALTEYGVNAGTLTEERVPAILKEFYVKIDEQLSRLDSGNGSSCQCRTRGCWWCYRARQATRCSSGNDPTQACYLKENFYFLLWLKKS
jgi:hypothetical protein